MRRKTRLRRLLCRLGCHRLGRSRPERYKFKSRAEYRAWHRAFEGRYGRAWGYTHTAGDGSLNLYFDWERCIFCGFNHRPEGIK